MLVQAKIRGLLDEVLTQTAKTRKGGSQALYFCFACNHYKRKLEVNLETGQWHCWTCNIKGSHLGSLLTKAKAPQSARIKMAELTGDMRVIQKRRKANAPEEVILPNEFLPLSQPTSSLEYKQALFYLKRRGLCREDILRYNIGYCEEGEYAFHIIVPSYDAEGNLNFFIGRRYYNIEGTIPYKKCEASMNFVGFENFINYDEPLNLCEGVFDAMAIRNNAVPLFGKYLPKKLQEAIIVNKVPLVNMILDNDAMRDSLQNCVDLQRYGVPVHIVTLDGKDPSALGFKAMNAMIDKGEPLGFSDLIRYKFSYDVRKPYFPRKPGPTKL